jgi:hypothetical protein
MVPRQISGKSLAKTVPNFIPDGFFILKQREEPSTHTPRTGAGPAPSPGGTIYNRLI